MAEKITYNLFTRDDLDVYHGLEVERTAAEAAETLRQAKEYANGLADNYDAAGTAQSKMEELANGQVKTNKEAIDAINNDETGILKQAKDYANDLNTAMDGRMDTAEGDIVTMKGQIDALEKGTYDDTEVRELVQANTDAIDAVEERVGVTETAIEKLNGADTVEGSVDNKIKVAKETLQTNITAEKERAEGVEAGLAERIKTVEDDYLKSADKEELQGNINTNTAAITKLNGDATVEGSVDKKVADAINTFATQITDDGTINTYKEILNYIATHGGEANEMAAAIDQLETLVGSKSVATQIAEAITAENLGQYATDEELAAAIARIVVLEGKSHEHANKAELDKIAEGDVAKWNAAEQNAKDFAQGLNDTMTVRMTTVETAVNETLPASITDAKKAGTDANAALEAYKTTNDAAVQAAQSKADANETAISGLDERIVALENVEFQRVGTDYINSLFA